MTHQQNINTTAKVKFKTFFTSCFLSTKTLKFTEDVARKTLVSIDLLEDHALKKTTKVEIASTSFGIYFRYLIRPCS